MVQSLCSGTALWRELHLFPPFAAMPSSMAAFPGPRSDILNATAEPRGSTHPRLIVLAVGINHTRALRYTGFNRITTRSSCRFRACRRGGRNGYAGAEWNGGGRLSSGPGPYLRHRHPCNTRDGLGHRSQRTALALTSPRTESFGIAHTLGGATSIPSEPSNPSN